MAGSIARLCELMVHYCDEANLGYDQSNRWDIRPGGECDCSSLAIECLRQAGFDVGSATYTGDMSDELCARGWRRIRADISTCQPGDILLNDGCHVCVVVSGHGWDATVAQASIDERGRISGGQAGDQTGGETNTRGVYEYSRGWDCILRYSGAEAGAGGVPAGASSGRLAVDGALGPLSVAEWQRQCGTTADGVVSGQIHDCRRWYPALTSVSYEADGSALMREVQRRCGVNSPSGIVARGSVAKLQGHLVLMGYDIGDAEAGVLDKPTARAIQHSLNDGAWS